MKIMREKAIVRVGVDLAKMSFSLHAVDRDGRKVVSKSVKREELLKWFVEQVPSGCLVGMEACASIGDGRPTAAEFLRSRAQFGGS